MKNFEIELNKCKEAIKETRKINKCVTDNLTKARKLHHLHIKDPDKSQKELMTDIDNALACIKSKY